jgi:hypothetical protein
MGSALMRAAAIPPQLHLNGVNAAPHSREKFHCLLSRQILHCSIGCAPRMAFTGGIMATTASALGISAGARQARDLYEVGEIPPLGHVPADM